MFLHVLETNDVLVNVFADLKAAVAAVIVLTIPTESNIAVHTEHVLLILLQFQMVHTWTKELAFQQRCEPITCLLLLDYQSASHLPNMRRQRQQKQNFHIKFYKSRSICTTWNWSNSIKSKFIRKISLQNANIYI